MVSWWHYHPSCTMGWVPNNHSLQCTWNLNLNTSEGKEGKFENTEHIEHKYFCFDCVRRSKRMVSVDTFNPVSNKCEWRKKVEARSPPGVLEPPWQRLVENLMKLKQPILAVCIRGNNQKNYLAPPEKPFIHCFCSRPEKFRFWFLRVGINHCFIFSFSFDSERRRRKIVALQLLMWWPSGLV